jgi:hypothetical protein
MYGGKGGGMDGRRMYVWNDNGGMKGKKKEGKD